MAINLRDIPDAVRTYLNTKVAVTIGPIAEAGQQLNPNEPFSFSVTVANANAANGGVALKNVKYRVAIIHATVAKLKAPSASTDLAGNPLVAGTEVNGFIFSPAATNAFSVLEVGDTDVFTVQGKAGSAPAGGSTQIQVRIIADVDVDSLFPKGEDTPTATRALQVVG